LTPRLESAELYDPVLELFVTTGNRVRFFALHPRDWRTEEGRTTLNSTIRATSTFSLTGSMPAGSMNETEKTIAKEGRDEFQREGRYHRPCGG